MLNDVNIIRLQTGSRITSKLKENVGLYCFTVLQTDKMKLSAIKSCEPRTRGGGHHRLTHI